MQASSTASVNSTTSEAGSKGSLSGNGGEQQAAAAAAATPNGNEAPAIAPKEPTMSSSSEASSGEVPPEIPPTKEVSDADKQPASPVDKTTTTTTTSLKATNAVEQEDEEFEADGGDKLWEDVDKDLGNILNETEQAKSSDDEDTRYDRFRNSDKNQREEVDESESPVVEGGAQEPAGKKKIADVVKVKVEVDK